MKNNKKSIYRRRPNKIFRYGFCVSLIVLSFVSALFVLGLTGSFEIDYFTPSEYLMRVVPCLFVFGISSYLLSEILY